MYFIGMATKNKKRVEMPSMIPNQIRMSKNMRLIFIGYILYRLKSNHENQPREHNSQVLQFKVQSYELFAFHRGKQREHGCPHRFIIRKMIFDLGVLPNHNERHARQLTGTSRKLIQLTI